jgi:transcription antitermination factor NusG
VYTISRHEKQVVQQLQYRAIDCFLPLYEVLRPWKTGPELVQFPLFPNYLFVNADAEERRQVIQLSSVLNIVGNRANPLPLSDDEIAQLRQSMATGRAEPHVYLTLGARVRVVRGPLTGAEGVLVRKKAFTKIVLTIAAIMRSFAVEVSSTDVEPIQAIRAN